MSRVRTVVITEIALVIGLLGFVGAAYALERAFELNRAVHLAPVTALVLSAIPAALWLLYFYLQDRHEPEPKHYVLGIYLLGLFVAGPTADFIVAQLTPQAPLFIRDLDAFGADRLVHAFLIVALAQELGKYAVVRYTVYLSPEFDEPMDGILYMTAAGIGLATWENYRYFQQLSGDVFLATGAAHAVVTTLAHACFAAVLGYALGRAKFASATVARRTVTLLAGLLVAAALNGQFDLVVAKVTNDGMNVHPWRGLAYAGGFAAVVFFITSLLIRRLLDISPFRPDAEAPPA